MKAGESAEALVVDLSLEGRGIARVAGKAVFVEGALPGERVRFRVRRARRQFDEAELLEILEPSADRVAPRCAHFGVCGGCTLQHLAPAAQLEIKQRQLLEALARIGEVRPRQVLLPIEGPPFAYRRRARLGVRYVHKKGRVLAGFRERDKPYVADVRRCEVLIERFANLPAELAELVEALSVREHVPQVELSAGDEGAALVFRVLQPPSDADLAAIERFALRHACNAYLQSAGPESLRPIGGAAGALRYAVDAGAVVLEFGPLDFVQVNRDINEALVTRALEALDPAPADRVLDLFCGLGNFTLPLARRAGRVLGVEGDAGLVARATANAARNGLANAEFVAADLGQGAALGPWAQGRFDLVLLDPPRAGAVSIVERMPQWGPRRVVYISCHPGSLARDAGVLVRAGGFELIGAGVMDMFPQTAHVESIAVFERIPERSR